jgi:protocatechuate 3,4-dioxygenase beta subunit
VIKDVCAASLSPHILSSSSLFQHQQHPSQSKAIMDPSQVKIPPMKDLTPDNITPNTIIINSQGPDKRLQYLLERLVTHLHDFVRETRLTTEEWMTALLFLTAVGQISSDTRQEFILLSDTLGLSTLVENINHPKPPNATEGTVLGPFHTDDAHTFSHGDSICSPGKGEPCLVRCTLRDTAGRPIAGAAVDIWETDETGHYDTQYADRGHPDCRGILRTDENGRFWFKAVRPVPYPIPHDGPVGKLLEKLHRHPYRPSHMHFMILAEGYDTLVT